MKLHIFKKSLIAFVVICIAISLLSPFLEAKEMDDDILNYSVTSDNFKSDSGFDLSYRKLVVPEFNVRGIYVTGWIAGIGERMDELIDLVKKSKLNSMVIDVKDDQGFISYQSDVKLAQEIGANRNKINNIESLLQKLKEEGIHTIARIVVFKDTKLASTRPDLALKLSRKEKEKIKNNDETQFDIRDLSENEPRQELEWKITEKRITYKSEKWVDPAQKEVWEYNISLAQEAIEIGFDEIQFDYIRFPALKDNSKVVLPKNKRKKSLINDFISSAYERLTLMDHPLSIDVFGLVTSTKDDMGIGQNFIDLSQRINIISPMIYPSHYSPGVFGLTLPEKDPYKTVYKSMLDAQKKTLGQDVILRPWLQDFSINHKYSTHEINEQLKALDKLGIKEWLLWNPRSRYTKEALID